VQFPGEETAVTGARLNLWGSHRVVYGFDIGVVNATKLKFGGTQVGALLNWNQGDSRVLGAQVAGIANLNKGKVRMLGVQAAIAANSNRSESTLIGLQVAALANLSHHTTLVGVQGSLYNTARVVYGVQVGLVNVADELHGLQIGLVNIHRKGIFPVCPVLNFGF
jgi:hypothetical protein